MPANKEVDILGVGRFMQLVRSGGWEYVERTNCRAIVAIVPVTDENTLIFVEQYRPALGQTVIEFPAGLVGDIKGSENEDLAIAARRELIEETGYDAESFAHLTEGPPAAGLCAEIVTFFMARGLTRVGAGGGDESESIIVHEVPVDAADDWLKSMAREGRLIDPKVYTGLYFCTKKS